MHLQVVDAKRRRGELEGLPLKTLHFNGLITSFLPFVGPVETCGLPFAAPKDGLCIAVNQTSESSPLKDNFRLDVLI